MSEKREHYRIKYRDGDRPTLLMGGVKFEIQDVSEQGMRFDGGPRYKPTDGTAIRGKITFKSGKNCAVEGAILRYDSAKHACIVKLTKGVPLALIMEEQRAILKKYNSLE